MKIKGWHVFLLLLVIFVAYGYHQGWFNTFLPAQQILPTPQPTAPSDEMVSVNKPLKIVGIDKYSGASSTGTVSVYDSDGQTLLESLSFSGGYVTTGNLYPSGKTLYIKTNDGSNAIVWNQIIVPKMFRADAESATYNQFTVKDFTVCSGSDTLVDHAGNSIADGGDYNKTATGSTATFTYSFYVASDNTGYIESHDAIYDVDLKAIVWVKIFGTNYENVVLSGFNGVVERGSAMYGWIELQDTDITKYKVGNNYVYSGAASVSFSLGLSGYTGDAADMQIYLEIYSDAEYFKSTGSYGPYAVQLAEQTVNLVD